ncbi:MAG: hypothetical protein HQM16_01265 [Deltaproteobacteria bacterium]|nr:hypothetical protein [Deltaproteobacteria bacterium]
MAELPPVGCYYTTNAPGFEGKKKLVCDQSGEGTLKTDGPTQEPDGAQHAANTDMTQRSDDPFRFSPGVDIDYNTFCEGVAFIRDMRLFNGVAQGMGMGMEAVAQIDDFIMEDMAHTLFFDPAMEAMGVEPLEEGSVEKMTFDWGVRTANAVGIFAMYHRFIGPGKAFPTWAQFKSAAAKYMPFIGMMYLMETKLVSSPDAVLNAVGLDGLEGWQHDAAYWGILGTGTAGALAYINHEYVKPVSEGGKTLSAKSGVAWISFWLAYSLYWRIMTDQGRALQSVDGQDVSGLNPLDWEWDYVNPDTAASGYWSWAVAAPAWGVLGAVSRFLTDFESRVLNLITRGKVGGGDFNSLMQLSGAETVAIDAAAPEILGRKLKFASGAFAKAAAKPSRVAYSLTMFANGLIAGMFAGNAMQQVRDYKDPSTLHGSSVRTVFTGGANVPLTHSLKILGSDVSHYQYYLAGMLFLYPYESCNEIKESLSTIARYQAHKFKASVDPVEKREIAGLIYKLGLASLPGTWDGKEYKHGERDEIIKSVSQDPKLWTEVNDIADSVEEALMARGVVVEEIDLDEFRAVIEDAIKLESGS